MIETSLEFILDQSNSQVSLNGIGQKDKLHYLNESNPGSSNLWDNIQNQQMFKGFVNLYEEQGAGIASNMMTFFKI